MKTTQELQDEIRERSCELVEDYLERTVEMTTARARMSSVEAMLTVLGARVAVIDATQQVLLRELGGASPKWRKVFEQVEAASRTLRDEA